ncbi:MAG: PIN domain-containing protein [Gammaproteobacteria bacterium]
MLFDLNVFLDVLQERKPHYSSSAAALSKALTGDIIGVFPAHGVTTLYYLVARHMNKTRADGLVDWLIDRFDIAPVDRTTLVRARSLKLRDFEDAVVAAAAEVTACAVIVTRNIADFSRSPVTALSPEEFLDSWPANTKI